MVKTTNDLIKVFNYSMSWSAIEALIYQALFLLHYSALFYAIGKTDYGIFSTGLALLYAWLMIGNLGFDYTLAPFFLYSKSDKSSFVSYFGIHWIIQIGIVAVGSFLFFYAFPLVMPSQFLQSSILPVIMTCLLFSESLKKSLRIVLQLALKNKITASIEIVTIASYMIIVWGIYFIYGTLNLETLLIPLLATSALSALVLHFFVYRWYAGLPENQESSFSYDIVKRIAKNRFYATFYIITQQLFSSNILVPAIAYNSGMSQAGVFTLISTAVYSITHVFHKMSASSSLTLFAWAKNQTLAFKQDMFLLVWNELSKIASLASIILIVNQIHVTTSSFTTLSQELILQGYAYVGILIIEFFAVAYEKFYLNEEKAHRLAFIQLIVITLATLTLIFIKNTTLILELLFVIRLISFIVLAQQSFRIWQLKPQWHSAQKIVMYGLPIAITLYFVLKIIIRSIY